VSRSRKSTPAGLFWIDKPAGPTSHDVVDWVRWALRSSQVGHCGTLDPAATGLLVVCVGAATKLAPLFTGVGKGYRATFVLGQSTTTADGEGDVVDEQPCSAQVERGVVAHLEAMVGPLSLPPPAFSAVHVDGERAHERARRGEAVTLPDRPMTVHSISDVEVGELQPNGLLSVGATFAVSKGTYIRSLAVELGRRAGVPAHMSQLRRLSSGSASLDDPRVVGPLTAASLGPAPGGKGTRWRIRPKASPDADRETQGEWLADQRLPPATGLPIPVIRLSRDNSDANALVARLGHGQAASASDPGWAGEPPAQHAVIVSTTPPDRDDTLIVVEHTEGAVRPKRVVTPA